MLYRIMILLIFFLFKIFLFFRIMAIDTFYSNFIFKKILNILFRIIILGHTKSLIIFFSLSCFAFLFKYKTAHCMNHQISNDDENLPINFSVHIGQCLQTSTMLSSKDHRHYIFQNLEPILKHLYLTSLDQKTIKILPLEDEFDKRMIDAYGGNNAIIKRPIVLRLKTLLITRAISLNLLTPHNLQLNHFLDVFVGHSVLLDALIFQAGILEKKNISSLIPLINQTDNHVDILENSTKNLKKLLLNYKNMVKNKRIEGIDEIDNQSLKHFSVLLEQTPHYTTSEGKPINKNELTRFLQDFEELLRIGGTKEQPMISKEPNFLQNKKKLSDLYHLIATYLREEKN